MDLSNEVQSLVDRERRKYYELSDKAQRSALPESFSLITPADIDKAKNIIEKLRIKGWDVYCVAAFQNPRMEYKFNGEIKTAQDYHAAFAEILKTE